ncbi:MAG: Na(+)/H(+) antiporter subunit D [Hellea sp.]|nr:Na(+)/H(+) antiporter subunit D [Hellea sp.]
MIDLIFKNPEVLADMFFSNPGFIIIFAGFLCAFLPRNEARKFLVGAAPIAAAFLVWRAAGDMDGARRAIEAGGNEFVLMRIDRLSMIWGYVFCLAGVLNAIYALHEKCRITDSSALIYMGAAVAGVFAGDFLTLFIFWELAALSSVFLVWKGGENAFPAGVRYLAIHILSGVLLLAGAVIYARSKEWDFTFGEAGEYGFLSLQDPGAVLLMIAMGIKCGFPFLHNWIQDAYPKASVTGTVILSAFTTKLALYALARTFAGEDILIYIGAIMTCFPVFFAVIENDLRRVLSYSLNNQLGFMVCGIGLGTELAMNGVAAHLAADVIFKGLLFMSMGAVLMRVGTAKASELGGLFRSMPYTTIFCLIGAGSIAAFPLLSAFVTKSMIIASAMNQHEYIVMGMLLFASAGVMEHSGIKVPYFAFFSHDSGKRVKEAPWNMLVAMGLASLLCVFFAFPWGGYQFLYSLLPFPENYYAPYTGNHVVTQLQLLFAAMLAFAFLKRMKVYPDERRAEILDFDWTYRRLGKGIAVWIDAMWTRLSANLAIIRKDFFAKAGQRLYHMFSPAGTFSVGAPSGLPTLLTGGMLVLVLIVVYLARL